MKTSILVSTFAALCLLITVAEKLNNNSAENSNGSLASNFYYSPAKPDHAAPASGPSVKMIKYNARTSVNAVADFDYLKFDIADYTDNTEMANEEPGENTFGYLKFDVSRYAESSEFISPDGIEMPVTEFAHLKFDVTEYSGNTELTSLDEIELPAVEFAHLKFDVNQYSDTAELTSFDEIELPANEYEYLKFDANNFIGNDDSTEITSLPEDENSYLKFDANKYTSQISQGSDNIGELPGNE